ncbi:hypothetical protein Cni_G07024 [Canna indica]|uniref:DUF1771 domain-containing protein n=1 Tax=Canna indica TaxID=4628 RepID=A0AAQ3JXT0_9LILI|nr:hypothetical protein Cni_G07024 [Canna indica]
MTASPPQAASAPPTHRLPYFVSAPDEQTSDEYLREVDPPTATAREPLELGDEAGVHADVALVDDDAERCKHVPVEPEWEEDDIYITCRKDAMKIMRSATKHSRTASNAYYKGEHICAHQLSMRAKEERMVADNLNDKILESGCGAKLWWPCAFQSWMFDKWRKWAAVKMSVVLEQGGSSTDPALSLVDRNAPPTNLRRSPRLMGKVNSGGPSLDRAIKRKELRLSALSPNVAKIGIYPESSTPDPSSKANADLSSLDSKDLMARLGKLGFKDVDESACELLRNEQGMVGSL